MAGQHTAREQRYESIVTDLRDRISQLSGNRQFWIGLAGAPGSGKSTLTEILKLKLAEQLTIIPMDGYHYCLAELDQMENPELAHARRGAPFTFNAQRFVDAMIDARKKGQGRFPGFDHVRGDPLPDQIELLPGSKIVIVEGNYVLLDNEPWCDLREQVFDQSWYLQLDKNERERRLLGRLTGTGLSTAEARRRIVTNDNPNAELLHEVSLKNADLIIPGV